MPQVACRPTGMLFGLQSSLHPFITHPTYRRWPTCRSPSGWPRCAQPEVRAALLAEEPQHRQPGRQSPSCRAGTRSSRSATRPTTSRRPTTSVAAVAEREGRTPEEVVLDWLLERDGTAFLFAPLASYVDDDHEAIREMMTHPRTVLGLSDGGAHCGLICDVDCRPTCSPTGCATARRGERLPLEQARAPADRPHRGRLRLRRPRHARARQAGRPQPDRPRRASRSTPPRWSSTSRPAAAASSSGSTATGRRSWPAQVPSPTASPPAPAPAASSASDSRRRTKGSSSR